jgi:hypothetical protein
MGWSDKSPVLAQRAPSEGPRWTRAVGDSPNHPKDEVHEQAWKGSSLVGRWGLAG